MPPAHACEICKRRKVKCDGVEPCANCQISRLHCCYSSPRTKRPRKSPRAVQQSPCSTIASDAGPDIGGSESTHPTLNSNVTDDLQQALLTTHQQVPPWSLRRGGACLSHSTSGGIAEAPGFHYDAAQVHSSLLASVGALVDSGSIVVVAHDCIDYFMQYLFPNTPITHEPTLRVAAALLTPGKATEFASSTSALYDTYHVSCLRKFSLITALCAFVTSTMPASPPSQTALLSRSFLGASRAMLCVYDGYDLEHPDSTSLTIRMWHSAAMQNTTGRVGTSYQYHAEAAFLAQRLRLHDETALQMHSRLESRILRASFWLLYLADKTAIATETRYPILHAAVSNRELTLLDDGDQEEHLLDVQKSVNQGALEERLFVGFHLKKRIWAAAADLLVEIRALSNRQDESLPGPSREDEVTRLTEAYLLFTSLSDQLPTWLRSPDAAFDDCDNEAADDSVMAYQKSCFWVQRSNIMTVFHCMRLVIVQKCASSNLLCVVGLSCQGMSCAMRKIEIVRDFLLELQIVPFRCYKAQGETAVERIRRVGTILLELVHNAESKTIEKVARKQFEHLLDLLAKLDSRASDELAGGPSSPATGQVTVS